MAPKQESDDIRPASFDAEIGSAEKIQQGTNQFEVFKQGDGVVDFRTVHWIQASVIFLKIIFATGVLSIPSSMNALGAFPGAVVVVALTLLNAYCAIVQGNFRNRHAGCHSIADMAHLVGGPVVKEIVGFLFLAAYVICAASGIIGVSTAFNALSLHATCTQWFSLVATVIVALAASVRKFEKIAWLTWVGFISVFIAVMIVVVGVTTRDRPAIAPQTGDFDLGFVVIGYPTFIAGMTACATIFCSSAATAAFLPVISEMKRPKDYNKAVYVCMAIVTSSYLAFSFVVYYWCGKWVASPSLGSAGPVIKRVAYGVGIIGLAVSACLYVHIGAKYIFVRVLRNSRHLQENTVIHWATWLGCTIGISICSFLIASGIPIFNYILALAGSLCFSPVAICLPGWLWCHDYSHYRKGNVWQITTYYLHVLMIAFGAFMTIGGTYSVIQEIIDAYASGAIGSAFSCADNSGTVV
ncbi:hypothetical protein PFICI_00464 [Pestalotiopsis fici W106-1]|uniref:Amino acid transporter transmembrane domain-containing protein n=1 Tax=Pestalotiopsis fici (strain W106-1 / CGMCC3.15140) TaxID=1229662 RepID=W3XMX0_PESFW|nr:uncharacterized protein PFICI_00464 [Pestalotiopsis fici W106-1]ETS86636.1 hypothetical protein PFICI_00464 [Pestalotiopsis fici W106-1]